MAQTVKKLPAMQETQIRSLGQEDLLEKGMANHSSIFFCKIPWTEEPGGLQSMGRNELDMTEELTLSLERFREFRNYWLLPDHSTHDHSTSLFCSDQG